MLKAVFINFSKFA